MQTACIRRAQGNPEKSLPVTPTNDESATPRYPLTMNERAVAEATSAIRDPSHPEGQSCAIKILNGRILKKNRTSKRPEKTITYNKSGTPMLR